MNGPAAVAHGTASGPRLAVIGIALLLGLAPSAGWVLTAWGASPLDAWGWAFLLAAAAWAVLVLTLTPPADAGAVDGAVDAAAWPLLAAFVLLGGGGLVFDVRIAVALAGLGLGWSLAWLLLGGRLGLLLLPALLVAALGLPTVGFMLERVWLALAPAIGLGAVPALGLKAGSAALALLVGVLLLVLDRRGGLVTPGLARTSYAVVFIGALAALAAAWQAPRFGPALALAERDFSVGDWYGAEVPVSPSEQELFAGSRRLGKLLYAGPDGGRISVLIAESDDVHDLHAPEYCLSGSGWVIGNAEAAETATALPLPVQTTGELAAARGDQRLAGVYWYSSPTRSTADIAGLRLARTGADEPFTLYLITAVGNAGGDARAQLASFLRAATWLRPTADGGGSPSAGQGTPPE